MELDETAWLGPLTKWVGRAQRPAEIPDIVQAAFRHLRSGRPRPVAIEVPPAVFAATEEVSLAQPAGGSPTSTDPEPRTIQRAAELLAAARRPVIWAGGGVMRARAATLVAELADYLQIPVVTTRQGKGSISELHPLSLGMAERRFQPLGNWLAGRDLILAVGTSHYSSGAGQQVVRIDVDEAEFDRNDDLLAIHGDAYPVMMALNRAVAAAGPSRADKAEAVQAEVAAINEARFDPSTQLQPQWGFMEAIHAALPDDAVVIQGMNQMGYYSRNYFRARAPQQLSDQFFARDAGLRLPDRVGRKGRLPGSGRRFAVRGRRFSLQRTGAVHGGAVRDQCRGHRIQRQRLWECSAGPDGGVRRACPRHEAAQPRFRGAGAQLWRTRRACG